jgi:uncharacterized membrane protein YhaH (DUF805 family)
MSTQNPYQAPQAQGAPFAPQQPAAPMSVGSILFSFQGRIPRRVFWLTNIAMTIVAMLIGFVIGFVCGLVLHDDAQSAQLVAQLVILPVQLLTLWISLALAVKRWHDRGKSGWWVLIGLIPIIGWIWAFVEVGCLRGTVGPNQYGLDPT